MWLSFFNTSLRIWPHRQISQPPKRQALFRLLCLPTEVLIEVMNHIGWCDVLNIRQVCRQLNQLSYDRSVWLSLLHQCINSTEPRLFWADKPLDAYNAAEIEYLVLRGKAAECIWTRDGIRPKSRREFSLDDLRRSNGIYLLPGGRWFLASSASGDLVYFDLNESFITPRVLIPSAFPDHSDVRLSFSIEMDFQSSVLAFTVGAGYTTLGLNSASLRLQVWHVEAMIDSNDHDGIPRLHATPVSSFEEESAGIICNISTFKNTLAYSVFHRRIDVVVVNWTSIEDQNLIYPRKIVSGGTHWVRLISEETVLCHDGTRFLAYSISDLPITSKPPSASTCPSPSPTCTAICGTSLMSGPFYVHDSVRFLCVVSPGLEGIIIQENPLRIEVLKLRSESMYSAQQTGYRHALGFHEESSSMAKVSWPEHAADDTCISQTRFKRFGCTAVSFLDEVSGRAVIARLGNPPFELIEFGV